MLIKQACGNCLHMQSFNALFDFGLCRKYNELRLYTSSCDNFKKTYTLKELKEIEERRYLNG